MSSEERNLQVLEQAYLQIYTEARKYQVGRYSDGCAVYLELLAKAHVTLSDEKKRARHGRSLADAAATASIPGPMERQAVEPEKKTASAPTMILIVAAGLVCVLFPAWLFWPRHTLVGIRTDPPGATVRSGDHVLGVTPLKCFLRRRQVTLVAELDGYHPAETTRYVTEATEEISLTLRPKAATCSVLVRPPNARLVLRGDGAKISGSGIQRVVEFSTPDGRRPYQLVASLDGHADLERELVPLPGQQTSLSLVFPAVYRLQLAPSEAEISANGPGVTIVDSRPRTLIIANPTSPGAWQIVARMEGYANLERELTPRPGVTEDLVLVLQPWGPPRAVAPFKEDEAKRHQADWAAFLKRPVVETNSIGMKLVLIPAGEFQMGSGESAEEVAQTFSGAMVEHSAIEHPQHLVRITKPFYLGMYEVTQGEWETVMGSKPWSESTRVKTGTDYPATYVSWEDAQEFCRRLSAKEGMTYRLPTEAEWEYACRAGTRTSFSFGDDASDLGEHAWYCDNASKKNESYAHRVGQKKPNPWGLYDMHGNVLERCTDLIGPYTPGNASDPTGPSTGSIRAIRGGHWDCPAWYCRSAYRCGGGLSDRNFIFGFRVAAVPSAVRAGRSEADLAGPPGTIDEWLILGPIPREGHEDAKAVLQLVEEPRLPRMRPKLGDKNHGLTWQRGQVKDLKTGIYLLAFQFSVRRSVAATLTVDSTPGGVYFWVNGDPVDVGMDGESPWSQPQLTGGSSEPFRLRGGGIRSYRLLGAVCVTDPQLPLVVRLIDVDSSEPVEDLISKIR